VTRHSLEVRMLIESALIVEVPDAETAVGRWRSLLDPVSLVGIPAHITILYPFVDRTAEHTLQAIRDIAASVPAFSFTLQSVARWPNVVYLAPTPVEPFRDLTRRVMERWPNLRPYDGKFDDIVPHLTVADNLKNEHLAATISDDVQAHLPISARAREVSLWVTDGASWTAHTTFPLGGVADSTDH
jgi:2'-5' RNA ligase